MNGQGGGVPPPSGNNAGSSKRKVNEMESVVDLTSSSESPPTLNDNGEAASRELKRARFSSRLSEEKSAYYDEYIEHYSDQARAPPDHSFHPMPTDHNMSSKKDPPAHHERKVPSKTTHPSVAREDAMPPPSNAPRHILPPMKTSNLDPDGFMARELDTVDATPNSRSGIVVHDKTGFNTYNSQDDNKSDSSSSSSSTGRRDGSFVSSVEMPDPFNAGADPPAKGDGNSNRGSRRLPDRIDEMKVDVSKTDNFSEPSPHKRTSRRSSNENSAEIVSSLMDLPVLSKNATLQPLSQEELQDLEAILEITPEDGWRDDWSGNLALVEKETLNPKRMTRNNAVASTAGGFRQALYTWAQKSNSAALKHMHNLFRFVYHLEDTPGMAKTILANADRKNGEAMEAAFRRVSYDPLVLQQDGWTTAKAPEPVGATGGAHRIGDQVRWQGADGIVIAYIHDHDLGDLWRGIWLEEGMESFDMEAEELIDARKKWERRAKPNSSTSQPKQGKKKEDQTLQRRSHRYTSASELRINGVEYGIVLAASFSKGARPGVYWPARVMHASEASPDPGPKNKRSAPRQRLDLIFLAPYWNSRAAAAGAPAGPGSRRVVESFSESLSRHGESLFNSGPLFDIESVDVSEEMLKEYPYDAQGGGINVDQLRVAFRFSGLPKAAFPRFLDSHRLALALKTYAQEQLPSRGGSDQASAGLFETHPMSVIAPMFPSEVLHLPYAFILSQLPAAPCEQMVHDGEERNTEPIIQLNTIIESMKPPSCWGQGKPQNGTQSPVKKNLVSVADSPFIDTAALLRKGAKSGAKPVEIDNFTKDLIALNQAIVGGANPGLEAMFDNLRQTLSSVTLECSNLSIDEKKLKARALARLWVFAKAHGEDAIGTSAHAGNAVVISEWRRACERVYKYITHAFSSKGYGNGVSVVLSDYRCNQHVTSCGCFERTVRLPAALKAARDVGAGRSENVQLLTSVEKSYIDTAENKVLMKAHSTSYLRRMKSRCSQIQGDQVVYLTEDSEGNGGEDTKGSRGTWKAAVASVGAAIKAVDMVVDGQCVNAFLATRPPGHHAGRNLHPMKAVSNGFCILNTAACAALHATTPLSEGGPGLRRVCVIDFDVHHGNGTQDILCSTFDPRFLYVSMHAGGAHVNGLPSSDDFDSEIHSPGGNSGKKGIYPGRCGDTSPHQGVLNIPLGPKVTSHAVGTALIYQVSPTVESFSPDLIILSAGFDAHRNDPLGLGGLTADDFGHITDVACQLASKCCSGRLISLLEGGYGVPCCRPQRNMSLAPETNEKGSPAQEESKVAQEESKAEQEESAKQQEKESQPETPKDTEEPAAESQRPQPFKLLDLGEFMPPEMDDQVPYALQRRLEKCHAEGFIECVQGHVKSLIKCNTRS